MTALISRLRGLQGKPHGGMGGPLFGKVKDLATWRKGLAFGAEEGLVSRLLTGLVRYVQRCLGESAFVRHIAVYHHASVTWKLRWLAVTAGV